MAAAALGFDMPLRVAFLLIAALGLGSALPSTPGYVGIYQFVAVTVLTPFGFSRNRRDRLHPGGPGAHVRGDWLLGVLGFWRYRWPGQRVSRDE